MATLPIVGTRVNYRFWDSEPFRAGTIVRYWHVLGSTYVDIKRDGYRETAVMPVSKLVNPALVTDRS